MSNDVAGSNPAARTTLLLFQIVLRPAPLSENEPLIFTLPYPPAGDVCFGLDISIAGQPIAEKVQHHRDSTELPLIRFPVPVSAAHPHAPGNEPM
jgi:hypothetical protein